LVHLRACAATAAAARGATCRRSLVASAGCRRAFVARRRARPCVERARHKAMDWRRGAMHHGARTHLLRNSQTHAPGTPSRWIASALLVAGAAAVCRHRTADLPA
jgi:hypothetical protein